MGYANDKRWLSPAADIVKKFQSDRKPGPYVLAELLGIRPSAIYRWMYAKQYGGTGGMVPQRWHRKLIATARDRNIPLTADEIIGVAHVERQVVHVSGSPPA